MSKKIIVINGSPRKNGNTSILLQHLIEGARAANAAIELVNLYDLHYQGCISCFACKLKGGKSYGQCPVQDDLAPLFEKIKHADALVLGSSIYFANITGEMRCFLERLLFQYMVYDVKRSSLFGRKIKTALLLTMGIDEQGCQNFGWELIFNWIVKPLEIIFGECKTLYSMNSYQFDDYSKYEYSIPNVQEKLVRKETIFQDECKKAYELGKSLVE